MINGIYLYSLESCFPLGKRRGKLEIHINGERVSGFIKMFARRNPLKGILKDDLIDFSGEFGGLFYELPFKAKGKINADLIEFDLITEKGTFHTVGKFETNRGEHYD